MLSEGFNARRAPVVACASFEVQRYFAAMQPFEKTSNTSGQRRSARDVAIRCVCLEMIAERVGLER